VPTEITAKDPGISDAVAFLASDQSRWVTGCTSTSTQDGC